MNYWLGLGIGFFAGAFMGVGSMCILQINRCRKCEYKKCPAALF